VIVVTGLILYRVELAGRPVTTEGLLAVLHTNQHLELLIEDESDLGAHGLPLDRFALAGRLHHRSILKLLCWGKLQKVDGLWSDVKPPTEEINRSVRNIIIICRLSSSRW